MKLKLKEIIKMFNEDRYVLAVTDTETGEIEDIELVDDNTVEHGWEKVYPEILHRFIRSNESGYNKVLSYLLFNKDHLNRIKITMRDLSELVGVDLKTVSRAFNKLYSLDLMKKERNGCYFISPQLMRYGGLGLSIKLANEWLALPDYVKPEPKEPKTKPKAKLEVVS